MPLARSLARIGASLLVTTALLAGGGIAASATPSQNPAMAPQVTAPDNTVLDEGETLRVGDALYADAGIATAARVLFRENRLQTQFGWGLWWSDGGWGVDVRGANRIVMQGDGNLVAYTSDNRAVWYTGTTNKPAGVKARAVVSLAGELIVYFGDKPVWNSNNPNNPTPKPEPKRTNRLDAGKQLNVNEQLVSENGEYRLIMQGDGNVVVYNKANQPQWNTQTSGKGGVKFVMQGDRNLVLYTSDNRWVWQSSTATDNPGNNVYLLMRNNGALEILVGDKTIWSSKGGSTPTPNPGNTNRLDAGKELGVNGQLVSENGEYRLVVQGDGNVVVYNKANVAQWNTQTQGTLGKLVMQGDANLVLYSADSRALWNSGTSRTNANGVYLLMRNSGALEILIGDKTIWSSKGLSTPTPTPTATPSPVVSNRLDAGKELGVNGQLVSQNGEYRLVVQGDGNVVVYNKANAAQWNTKTQGSLGKLVMQGDANLVLYSADNKALWNSGTARTNANGVYLLMRNSGALEILIGDKTIWSSKTASEPVLNNRLRAGDSLAVNGQLVSENGEYRLVVQGDGNVVVYNKANVAQWNTQTQGTLGKLVMQTDGNLVLYSADNKALWNSGTARNNADGVYLLMRNTGALEILIGDKTIWSSKGGSTPTPNPDEWRNGLLAGEFLTMGRQLKSENGAYRMVFQTDGNLVIYNQSNSPLWNSGTAGKADADKFLMQGDGNLVLYSKENVPLWNSQSAVNNPTNPRVILQNDGVMVIKHGDNVVWSSSPQARR